MAFDSDDEGELESPEEIARQIQEKAVRREQRFKQRAILDIIHDERPSLENINTGRFENVRVENNAVFQTIFNSREQLLDAVILKKQVDIFQTMASKAENLSLLLDADKFTTAIKDLFTDNSSGHFSWSLLGKDVGALLLSVPSFDTMMGPIKKPEKVRKQAVRRGPKEKVKEARPEEVVNTEQDQEEPTNERILILREVISQISQSQAESGGDVDYAAIAADVIDRVKSGHATAPESPGQHGMYGEPVDLKPVDLLKVLVDPEDPVQTVENFFDFAFLIKERQAAVEFKDHKPIAAVLPKDAFDEVPRRQMVLSLNMKELKELSKLLYDVDCVDSLASQAARRIPSSRQSLFTPRHSVSRLSLDSVGSSSASTSRSQGSQSQSQSQSSGTRRRNSLCPLHRDDPLYLCRDAAEQSEILAVRAEEKRRASIGKSQTQSQRKSQAAASQSQSSSPMSQGGYPSAASVSLRRSSLSSAVRQLTPSPPPAAGVAAAVAVMQPPIPVIPARVLLPAAAATGGATKKRPLPLPSRSAGQLKSQRC